MTAILIDTNVLVYAFDRSVQEKCARAETVLDLLQVNHLGCLSVQSISEFIRATTRGALPKLSPQEAVAQADWVMNSFPIYPLTPTTVRVAFRGLLDYRLSYYDAQIWACAFLNQIPVVFSEDFSDEQTLEGVRFVNPFSDNFKLEDWL